MAYQIPLLEDSSRIVNVASVPQRSPFRYPCGKTWLVPIIRRWFAHMPAKPTHLIEPFAGGGIVGLTVAFEGLADHVTLVELDAEVGAVWETILSDDGSWLAERITDFDITHDNVRATLGEPPMTTRDRAFATILKNRVNHGGIMAPGSGVLKHGENGKGLRSRWYPETLSKRIRAIAAMRDRISFAQGDGIAAMQQHATEEGTAFFIDPPYTAAGKKAGTRLYTHWVIDHQALFRTTATLAGDFLMTYDDTTEIADLAGDHHFTVRRIPMKSTHHAQMLELLVGKDLVWCQ